LRVHRTASTWLDPLTRTALGWEAHGSRYRVLVPLAGGLARLACELAAGLDHWLWRHASPAAWRCRVEQRVREVGHV
jgi:hypothetical protein